MQVLAICWSSGAARGTSTEHTTASTFSNLSGQKQSWLEEQPDYIQAEDYWTTKFLNTLEKIRKLGEFSVRLGVLIICNLKIITFLEYFDKYSNSFDISLQIMLGSIVLKCKHLCLITSWWFWILVYLYKIGIIFNILHLKSFLFVLLINRKFLGFYLNSFLNFFHTSFYLWYNSIIPVKYRTKPIKFLRMRAKIKS